MEGLGLGESLDGEAAMLVHSAAQCCVDSCVRNQVSLKLKSNLEEISWSNVSFELGRWNWDGRIVPSHRCVPCQRGWRRYSSNAEVETRE